ncbi:putative ATP-dependent DNA helicase [Operophtera brumata]|uniref:Putative ATP-dependent DNA helicase n=1 Tax=Operophtera brumata TaxID=104452 RepID=A0A0L7KXX3_OPEBR|nr:putative ATP-dependent DNA helicase [Operophtera brumata]
MRRKNGGCDVTNGPEGEAKVRRDWKPFEETWYWQTQFQDTAKKTNLAEADIRFCDYKPIRPYCKMQDPVQWYSAFNTCVHTIQADRFGYLPGFHTGSRYEAVGYGNARCAM